MSDEVQIHCACPGSHPWREHGFDDPEVLREPTPGHAEWSAKPAFSGPAARPLTRSVVKKTAFHTRWNVPDAATLAAGKDLIVLHYTEGSRLPTWWGTDNATFKRDPETGAWLPPAVTQGVGATTFGVDRAGAIEQYYPAECWNHHASGRTTVHKRSIGIELANLGWVAEVKSKAGEFLGYASRCAWLGKELPDWITDDLVPADALTSENQVALPRHFERADKWIESDRETVTQRIKWWHDFPPAQLAALVELVDRLCEAFGIPRRALEEDQRYRCHWPRGEGCAFTGIVSHMNFIQEQERWGSPKWDIGPAFPWNEFLEGIGAPTGQKTRYYLQLEQARGVGGIPAGALQSEAPSPTVRRLEQQLTYLGFRCGPPDGIRDAQTREGIRAYQTAQGLEVDGEITIALLEHVQQLYGLRVAQQRHRVSQL